MDHEKNYTFDAKFEGNILLVGRMGCGKTTLVQNVAKINYFEILKKFTGYKKLSFLPIEKIISGTVLKDRI